MEPSLSPASPPRLPVRAYARGLRAALVAAWALSAGALLLLAGAVVFLPLALGEGMARPGAPLAVAALLAAAPLLAAALARRSARATARVERGKLVLEGRGGMETPVAALSRARPFRLPLPADGLALELAAGRPYPLALETDDPAALLDLLAATGASGVERPPARLAWARARARLRPSPLELAVRWILLPAGATAVAFRSHQLAAFGGPLGEWQLHGLTRFLATLAAHAAGTIALLALVGAAARALAEAVAALWTALAPAQAGAARRSAEWLCRAVLYGGVPAVVALRYLG